MVAEGQKGDGWAFEEHRVEMRHPELMVVADAEGC